MFVGIMKINIIIQPQEDLFVENIYCDKYVLTIDILHRQYHKLSIRPLTHLRQGNLYLPMCERWSLM